jgi:hypothetical protein
MVFELKFIKDIFFKVFLCFILFYCVWVFLFSLNGIRLSRGFDIILPYFYLFLLKEIEVSKLYLIISWGNCLSVVLIAGVICYDFLLDIKIILKKGLKK